MRQQLAEESFAKAWAEGRTLTWEEIIQLALTILREEYAEKPKPLSFSFPGYSFS